MIKLSNSRINTYEECPYKYYLKYVQKISTETIYSSLHLGSALDTTFNKLLLATKDGIAVSLDELNETFKQAFTWYKFEPEDTEDVYVPDYLLCDYYDGEFKIENMLAGEIYDLFEKFELSPEQVTKNNKKAFNFCCWSSNYAVGLAAIRTYVEEILPEVLKRFTIETIQEELKIEDGVNVFTAILDLTGKCKTTGEYFVIDNKSASASSMKSSYGKNCVTKSQQLSLYCSFKEYKKAAYVVYQKTILPNGLVPWKIVTGEPSEETVSESFDLIQKTLDGISEEQFNKNEKSCWAYNRKCVYYGLCKFGNSNGLYKKKQES